jgi:hypothetical protein
MDAYNATDDPHRAPAADEAAPGTTRPTPSCSRSAPSQPDPRAARPGRTSVRHQCDATRTLALSIEPSIYLDALVRDFLFSGGRIVIRKFDTPRDLAALAEPIVVNCTGLGSFTLFDDQELVPVKGQLTALVPQPEVDYRASGPTAGGVQATMNSRRDGIIVGNLQDPGNWSLEPDEEVRQRNVNAAIEFFSSMRVPPPGVRTAASEPPRVVPPVEAFFDAES